MLHTLLVEDNLKLRRALKTGLENTGAVQIIHACGSSVDALAFCLNGTPPDVILMDVQLEGETNGIQAAVEKMGVTRERIRQIEAKAIRRLRQPRIKRKFQSYLFSLES